MRQSRDFWDYATKVLPAAEAGDPDAQYFLSRALEYCDQNRRFFLVRRGERLTKDEVLQWARQRKLREESAATAFDRCHSFQEKDTSRFGANADWLAKATESGQPAAQSTTALKMLFQEQQHDLARAGGVPDPSPPIASGGLSPRELLLSAVQNGGPEVLWNVGDAQGLLHPGAPDINQRRYAWYLLACRNGFDCSPTADWVLETCHSDPVCGPGNTGEDVIQYLAGDQWPAVQRLADDIHDKIQAGSWAALDLGS